jgi:hypothetical protein
MAIAEGKAVEDDGVDVRAQEDDARLARARARREARLRGTK